MSALRFILGSLLLLLGVVGLAASIAGIIELWSVKQPLEDRSAHALSQIDRTLTASEGAMVRVQEILKQAREDLVSLKAATAANNTPESTPLQKATVKMLARQVSPQLSTVQAMLAAGSEVAVVANTFLKEVDRLPLVTAEGLDPEQLKDVSGRLDTLAVSARKMSQELDDGTQKVSMEEVDRMASDIDKGLARIIDLLGEYRGKLARVQKDAAELTTSLPRWLQYGSIGLTVALVWIALGQASLAAVGWRWLWGKPSPAEQAQA